MGDRRTHAHVQTRRNRETGTEISVWDCRLPGTPLDPEDGTPWLTICEEHSTICTHPTLRLALDHSAQPSGWCQDCYSLSTGTPVPVELDYDEEGNVL
jgi:hypothetical protein